MIPLRRSIRPPVASRAACRAPWRRHGWEYIITPETTYIVGNADDQLDFRRIFTDGRDWPKDGEIDPTYLGYSIGKMDRRGRRRPLLRPRSGDAWSLQGRV